MPRVSLSPTPHNPPAPPPQTEPEPIDRFQIAVQSARGNMSDSDWIGLTAQQRSAAIYARLRQLDVAGRGKS